MILHRIETKSGTVYHLDMDAREVKRIHTGDNPLDGDAQWRHLSGKTELPQIGRHWIQQFDGGDGYPMRISTPVVSIETF